MPQLSKTFQDWQKNTARPQLNSLGLTPEQVNIFLQDKSSGLSLRDRLLQFITNFLKQHTTEHHNEREEPLTPEKHEEQTQQWGQSLHLVLNQQSSVELTEEQLSALEKHPKSAVCQILDNLLAQQNNHEQNSNQAFANAISKLLQSANKSEHKNLDSYLEAMSSRAQPPAPTPSPSGTALSV